MSTQLSSKRMPDTAPHNTAPNFDKLAPVYRWMEWLSFGPFLHRCRCAFLSELSSARRALILGDGDGRFTAKLLRNNSAVHIDAVDLSPVMLQALAHRTGANATHVRTHTADARTWLIAQPATAPPYDLVVTHFFLDCFTTEEVHALATCIRQRLTPDARWILSDFAEPPGSYGRFIARPVVAFLYRAFGLLTGLRIRRLPDHVSALEQAGFILERRRSLLHGLLLSEKWRPDQV